MEADDEQELCFCNTEVKKRRLKAEQVEFLEKSFEIENRLEPQKKTLLAKEVGLQEKQVAMWFQNRRARCKSKLLEKDYCNLQLSFQTLKADYDELIKQNEELRNEIILLSEKMKEREKKLKKEQSDEGKVVLEPNADSMDSALSQQLEQDGKNKPEVDFQWHEDLQPNCGNLGFPVHNQGTWLWKY